MNVGADRSRTIWILIGLALAPAALAALDLSNPRWSWVALVASYFVNSRVGWLPTLACLSLAGMSGVLIGAAGTVAAFLGFAVCWLDVIGGPTLSLGPYPSLVGLAQRVTVWVDVAWLAVVAIALRRIGPRTGPVDAGG